MREVSRTSQDSVAPVSWRKKYFPQNTVGWVRPVRLSAGCVLLTYLSLHFANHALGLLSLGAMEAGLSWLLLIWRNPVGTVLLYGALGCHALLGLWGLYQRRRLRMPLWEALQVALGLAIPPLLTPHLIGTRLAHAWFDINGSYASVLLVLWELRPDYGLRQLGLLFLAWVHGCIGVHFWLRLQPWYPRLLPWLYSVALLLPVLACLGFVQGGREVSRLAREPGWSQALLAQSRAPDAPAQQTLAWVRTVTWVSFGIVVGGVFAARALRQRYEQRRGGIRIAYPADRQVVVPLGLSVLEASRLAHIPHASVCGGRGRCSTCRIRVTVGLAALPPANPEEQRVLDRVGAPPGVRLACQLRPTADLAVIPLLPPQSRASAGFRSPGYLSGQEQDIAVLFADLRGFTRLAEPKLPYDVVFFLNRYFEAIGGAIKRSGGVANQFTGDGVMALFGIGVGGAEGCRRALLAASTMLHSLDALSQTLAADLPEPLRMGIGIHVGPVVVGQMGYAETTYLTAVGDTVHVASRLEGLTKDYACPLVVSEQVAIRAGADVTQAPRHELTVRNRQEPLAIYVIEDVHALAARFQTLSQSGGAIPGV